jgi:hypothetical protein
MTGMLEALILKGADTVCPGACASQQAHDEEVMDQDDQLVARGGSGSHPNQLHHDRHNFEAVITCTLGNMGDGKV